MKEICEPDEVSESYAVNAGQYKNEKRNPACINITDKLHCCICCYRPELRSAWRI